MEVQEYQDIELLCHAALSIIRHAELYNVCLRALGGVGVAICCDRAIRTNGRLARNCHDIDIAGYSQDKPMINHILGECGFSPDSYVNSRAHSKRLVFWRDSDGVKIDIFLDCFHMCHSFSFEARLGIEDTTLTLTDLLLTKMQVLHMENRDILDACAILSTATLTGIERQNYIDLGRISAICGQDWGWYRTSLQTIAVIQESLSVILQNNNSAPVIRLARQVESSIRNAPRSLRWKCRSLLGELIPWYDLPRIPFDICGASK